MGVLVGRRLQPRPVHLGQDAGRVGGVEEQLPARVAHRAVGVLHRGVVHQQDQSVVRHQGRRADLDEELPERARAGGLHQRLVVGARRPVDQVVGPRVPDRALAEVHQVAAVDRDRQDAAGLAPRGVLAVALRQEGVEVREHRPVLRPLEQVGRRRQAQLGRGPVPAGVGQVVGAVDLRDAGVLHAVPVVVLARREHRLGAALEVQSVVAGGIADVGDDVVGVRAVEQHHLAVLDDRGRVVDAGRLPGLALGRHDRVLLVGAERAQRELSVRVRGGHVFPRCRLVVLVVRGTAGQRRAIAKAPGGTVTVIVRALVVVESRRRPEPS